MISLRWISAAFFLLLFVAYATLRKLLPQKPAEQDIALPPRDFHPQEPPYHIGGTLRFTTGANDGCNHSVTKGRYAWFGEGV